MSEFEKSQAEQANYKFVHEWFAGLGMSIEGIDLADTLEYDLLALMGRAYLAAGANDGQP